MDHWRDQSEKPLEIKEIRYGGDPTSHTPALDVTAAAAPFRA